MKRAAAKEAVTKPVMENAVKVGTEAGPEQGHVLTENMPALANLDPAALRETIDAQTRSVLDTLTLITPEEHENLLRMQGELERLRLESASMAHRRLIVEMVTRPIVSEIKHKFSMFNAPYKRTEKASEQPEAKNKVETGPVDSAIFIPPFHSNHRPPRPKDFNKAAIRHHYSARAVTGKVVPSMAGSLPAEVADLPTVPATVPTAGKRKKKAKVTKQIQQVEHVDVDMAKRLAANEQQLAALKKVIPLPSPPPLCLCSAHPTSVLIEALIYRTSCDQGPPRLVVEAVIDRQCAHRASTVP